MDIRNEARRRLLALDPESNAGPALRRRIERLRFRSQADYFDFIVTRAIERGQSSP